MRTVHHEGIDAIMFSLMSLIDLASEGYACPKQHYMRSNQGIGSTWKELNHGLVLGWINIVTELTSRHDPPWRLDCTKVIAQDAVVLAVTLIDVPEHQ